MHMYSCENSEQLDVFRTGACTDFSGSGGQYLLIEQQNKFDIFKQRKFHNYFNDDLISCGYVLQLINCYIFSHIFQFVTQMNALMQNYFYPERYGPSYEDSTDPKDIVHYMETNYYNE